MNTLNPNSYITFSDVLVTNGRGTARLYDGSPVDIEFDECFRHDEPGRLHMGVAVACNDGVYRAIAIGDLE